MSHAYATTNLLTGLAAGSFVWSNAAATNRGYLNDGRLDKVFSVGAVAAGVTLVIDLGSAQTARCAAVLNSNIATATAGALRIRGADDAAITVGVETAKAASTLYTTAPRHKDHALSFDSVSKRYLEFAWTWTGSFALTLGEVFVGVHTSLTRLVVYGSRDQEEYVTSRFESYTRESRGHFIGGPIRVKELPFEDLSETERDALLAMFRATFGGSRPMLWIQSVESGTAAAAAAEQDCILGRLSEETFGAEEFDFGRYNPDGLKLRSLGREIGA